MEWITCGCSRSMAPRGKALTDFKTEHIYDFHWSFDGKQLAIVRGHTESDVVLLRSAQP